MKKEAVIQASPLEKLLSMDEARDILGISKSTLYSWICQRKIRVVKAGSKSMFRPSDIREYIENHTIEPININRTR